MSPVVVLALFACSSPPPASWEDCAALGGADRLDCLSQQLPKVFCEDPVRGEALVNEQVADATVRDYIWYRVTSDVEPNNARWCAKIGDAAIKERCQSVVKRPHLQRGVTPLCPGARKPGAEGGSAPPSATPPPVAGDLAAPPPAASSASQGLPAAAPH